MESRFRVLLTGFGPFGEVRENPSGLAVRELEQRLREAHGPFEAVEALVLPVVYREAAARLRGAFWRLRPHLLLATGVHRRETFRLEQRAHNRDDSTMPDEAGEVRSPAGTILHGAPASLASTLPIEAMHSKLANQSLSVERSDSAGGYLCNHIFFHACLLAAEARERSTRPVHAGFVHLPPLRAGELTFAQLLEGLSGCLEACHKALCASGATER